LRVRRSILFPCPIQVVDLGRPNGRTLPGSPSGLPEVSGLFGSGLPDFFLALSRLRSLRPGFLGPKSLLSSVMVHECSGSPGGESQLIFVFGHDDRLHSPSPSCFVVFSPCRVFISCSLWHSLEHSCVFVAIGGFFVSPRPGPFLALF